MSKMLLGVIIDNSLKFDTHVNNVCKKVSKLQFLMFKIKSYLTYEAQQIFYNSYILPCFDYCITLWGYSRKSNLDKLYMYQKKIGSSILNDYISPSHIIFQQLGWLTIYERVDFITLKQMYKCIFEEMPSALTDLFEFQDNHREVLLKTYYK